VAAGLVSAALGTDTGGSIRIPAALCGVVGLKPTYGRVETRGVVPLSWSLDHLGPITRSVGDAALLLDLLAGEAAEGPSCAEAARAGAAAHLGGVRVGVPQAWLAEGMSPGVARAWQGALDLLRRLGAAVREVELPASLDLLLTLNRILTLAESSAWHEPFLAAGRLGEYGPNLRPRLVAGQRIRAVDYLKALRLRQEVSRRFAAVWRQVDLLALPTVPITAPPLGQGQVEVGPGRHQSVQATLIRWTAPFNVLGTPACSLPSGWDEGGLPAGLQLVAAPGDDAFLCFAAAACEAADPDRMQHARRLKALWP
jgi:aspartyl-tRNA(Asn)/glutamyl-tRNA(Gln) amidotransferase subunit A